MLVLPGHHHTEAKRKAARGGISPSEHIRGLVARDLKPSVPADDPSVIFGLFDSGGSKIADGKQAMISEAIEPTLSAGRRGDSQPNKKNRRERTEDG